MKTKFKSFDSRNHILVYDKIVLEHGVNITYYAVPRKLWTEFERLRYKLIKETQEVYTHRDLKMPDCSVTHAVEAFFMLTQLAEHTYKDYDKEQEEDEENEQV